MTAPTDPDYVRIYRYGVKYLLRKGHQQEDAKDIAQQSIERAARTWDKDKSPFERYFFLLCRYIESHHIERKKSYRAKKMLLFNLAKPIQSTTRPLFARLIEIQDHLDYMMADLPARSKDIMLLWAQGYVYREIGEMYGISTSMVFKTIRKSISSMRELAFENN